MLKVPLTLPILLRLPFRVVQNLNVIHKRPLTEDNDEKYIINQYVLSLEGNMDEN